jgi:hypothetical protein
MEPFPVAILLRVNAFLFCLVPTLGPTEGLLVSILFWRRHRTSSFSYVYVVPQDGYSGIHSLHLVSPRVLPPLQCGLGDAREYFVAHVWDYLASILISMGYINENFPSLSLHSADSLDSISLLALLHDSLALIPLSYSAQSLTTLYIAEAMYTLKALLLICSIPFTLGQYGNPPPSTSSTAASTASATPASGVQVVTVGQNGLSFSPNSITAAVGSFVEFHFFPPTHSVAQSSFSTPCAPPSNGTGFWSGLIQSSGGQNVKLFLNHCIHNSLGLSC